MIVKPLPDLEPAVFERLGTLAEMLAEAEDDWCLIGGTALVLLEVPSVRVRDMDVVLSVRDAERVLGRLGVVPPRPEPSERFRSRVYAQIGDDIQFDLMAGFEVRTETGWESVPPQPSIEMGVGAHSIFVPSREEMARILRMFGRPKDLERLQLLEAA
jgi:hypothetical protein